MYPPRRSPLGRGALVLLAALSACSTAIHFGTPPPIDKLGALHPGVSTTADITAALGTPQGRGGVLMPGNPAENLWVYESQDAEGVSTHVRLLLVIVDPATGRYLGHLWLRSGQLLAQKP
jgi:hypothetical protein